MNHAPTRIVQPIFPLLTNIPILIVNVCIVYSDRIDNNGIECTVCKETCPYKSRDSPSTSYYETSNTWKCSKCKHLGPRSRGRGRLQNRYYYLLLLLIYLLYNTKYQRKLNLFNIFFFGWTFNQRALNNACPPDS